MNNLPIEMIVIHCSASPHRNDTAADVHAWHEEAGWAGIGYHYTIDQYGDIEAGRPEYWQGAHVRGYNLHTLGVMLFGIRDFTDEQFVALRSLLVDLKRRHNNPRILGHCDLDPRKECPGFDVKQWLNEQGL